MSRRLKLEASLKGRSFTNKYGETCTVMEIISAKQVVVVFENGYTNSYQKNALKLGIFKTPYSKSVAGVGFIGEGVYSHNLMNLDDNYILWHNVINRCYNAKKLNNAPHYEDVTVCEFWHNFQYFSKWFFSVKERLNLDTEGRKFVLDKDLLGGKL